MTLKTIPPDEVTSIDQACAVPFRTGAAEVEFCLITSSEGRWIFPKGFVEQGETYTEAALKEAFEEAGLHGSVVGEPIGCYEIEKHGRPHTVIAYLMEVIACDDVWAEAASRQRRWATPEEARDLVSVPEVDGLLQAAFARIRAA